MPRIVMPSATPRPQQKEPDPKDKSYERDPTAMHPKLERMRSELKTALDWTNSLLVKNFGEDAETRKISAELEKIPTLPSEQVMPRLKSVSDMIHRAKVDTLKSYRKDDPAKSGKTSLRPGTQPYVDVEMALQTAFKAASQVSSSTRHDMGLYQLKPGIKPKNPDQKFFGKPQERPIVDQECFDRWANNVKLFAEGKTKDFPMI